MAEPPTTLNADQIPEKHYKYSNAHTNLENMTKLVALVTGANKGIGYHVARTLAANHDVKVYIGARDTAKGEAAVKQLTSDNLHAEAVQIDVNSPESIQEAARHIDQREGRLDILINNAGIIPSFGNVLTESSADVRRGMETNLFGLMDVTQAFIPLLQKSPLKSIVNVSTSLASLSLRNTPSYQNYSTPLAAYTTSKAAQNMYTVQLAHALQDQGFKVNAADPGYTKTDLNHNSGTLAPSEAAKVVVKAAFSSETGLFFCKNGFQPW